MSDTHDAEVVPGAGSELAVVPERSDFVGYAGVATVALLPDKAKELTDPFDDEAYDILPTGEVYVSQVHYRRRLNAVFGPGGWALVPRGPFAMNGNAITREYALVGPGGRFISEAIGEAEYQPTNDRMTYASACEAAKSNALTRCCKDLGIASECWDRRFAEKFKAERCGAFWRKNSKARKPEWRRLDATPFYDESEPVKKTPNATSPAQERQPGDDSEASLPPSGALSCRHCGSVNVVPEEGAPNWIRCKDCNRGSKIK
jgi:hypothetical protein